ncbi:Hypothetical protein BC94_0759 [Mycoplasmopsis bovis]|uniref:Uncharacterized protein n=1 Tax=Mycoplasmopsis bovis TaxID=28903 RepID=A0A8D4A230_MYCBV|nr:Hypothetical protein BC85_0755 [Mycoplasmopsis bovis]AMW25984.1 Hypothetical protein BC94_0759 [Mycoplasmopsis bovis]AMW26613.1 Hypothetical protein BC93_0756 [Mycoplasmopsis bovis]
MLLFIIERYNQKRIIIHNNVGNIESAILANVLVFSKTIPVVLQLLDITSAEAPGCFNKLIIRNSLSPIKNLSGKNKKVFLITSPPRLISRLLATPLSTNVYLMTSDTLSSFTCSKYVLSSKLAVAAFTSFKKSLKLPTFTLGLKRFQRSNVTIKRITADSIVQSTILAIFCFLSFSIQLSFFLFILLFIILM